jgi:hypothetical protein
MYLTIGLSTDLMMVVQRHHNRNRARAMEKGAPRPGVVTTSPRRGFDESKRPKAHDRRGVGERQRAKSARCERWNMKEARRRPR